jgi:hypothetical protein
MRKNRLFKVGLLGCMAERLKTKLLEADKNVDIIWYSITLFLAGFEPF